MTLNIIIVLFYIFSLVKAPPPSESHQYRTDYEYNRITNAFYKFHIEYKRGYEVKHYCEIEGAKVMTTYPPDLTQGHGMFKKYPDLDNYAWVDATDQGSHESAEEHPLINLPDVEGSFEDFRSSLQDCDVMTRSGVIQTLACFNNLPFICKVEAKDAPYDEHCDVYATGYTYFPDVGSCYKVSEYILSWNEAFAECQAEGAHLVVINSEAEHIIIKNITLSSKPAPHSFNPDYFLAGFLAIKPSREFKTVFNQTLEQAGYSEWSYTEPNNVYGTEYCGSVFMIDGKLNDVNCIKEYAFICEKEVHK